MRKFLISVIAGIAVFIANPAYPGDSYIEIIIPQIRAKKSMVGKLFGLSRDAEVYMGIYIEGGVQKEDALVGIICDQAGSYKFFKRSDTGKTMKEEMEMLFIPLNKKTETNLAFLGPHIRLYDIKDMPKEGEKFPLTLVFREAGQVKVEASVISPVSFRGK